MKHPHTTPPSSLSAPAKTLWRKLVKDYDIEDQAGLLLLGTALEAFDRMKQCQAAIKRDGPMVRDRFGQLKSHPLLPTERDARSQMLAALRALNLDIEPIHDRPGRPAGR